MSRFLAALAAMGAGAVAWIGIRGRTSSAAMPIPEPAAPAPQPAQPAPEPAAFAVPAPPVLPPNRRLSPEEVLSLRPWADPEGWLPPADLLAFCEVESSFRPNAYRFEPRLGEASYGLMQLLASTARDMGHGGPAEGLYDPLTNLTLGIRYTRWIWDFLARRLGREPTEAEWLGAYNAGVGNVLDRGFIPVGYVARWQAARDRYAGFNGWGA